jgi:hypothetical protein
LAFHALRPWSFINFNTKIDPNQQRANRLHRWNQMADIQALAAAITAAIQAATAAAAPPPYFAADL